MRLQSAIFDMDGTLLDSMHIWNAVGPKTLRSMGIEPAPDLGDRLMLMTFRDGAALCKEEYHLSESVEEIMDLTKARVRSFYETQVQAKPGVKKFLSLLKMEGVWMYIATNTDRDLVEAALKHTGLDGYFRGILTCGEVGVGKKDSPEIYERCLRRLRGNKKDTVIFEDALHAIQTAKTAGFRVCGVYDPSAEDDQEEIKSLSDYYIRSFEEMFETEVLD